ncbi:MAG: NfeD family protein [Sulfurimonas sp.]|nr:NfeD family protein [Sulfurimonas sp.]
MIETISASYLLAIGILLIGLEAITFSFILFFIGLGFVVVAIVSYFYGFENGIVQIAIAFVIALISAFSLRGYLLQKLSKPSDKNEERSHISGVGYVQNGAVKFDGTYWESLDDLSGYKDGDKVEIVDVVNNMVVLKRDI